MSLQFCMQRLGPPMLRSKPPQDVAQTSFKLLHWIAVDEEELRHYQGEKGEDSHV